MVEEIIIKYKIDSQKRIKIFGNKFVKNNKKNCKIKVKKKEKEIIDYYEINLENEKNNELEIILIGINNISDLSYMFFGCSSLLSLSDISKWNTSNITNMNSMFENCSSLISLPDISNWNTSNVTNMSYIFNDCSSLIFLPDISKWDISNVTDIS